MVDGQWAPSRMPRQPRFDEHPVRPVSSLDAARRKDVVLADTYVASVSFADDVMVVEGRWMHDPELLLMVCIAGHQAARRQDAKLDKVDSSTRRSHCSLAPTVFCCSVALHFG